MTQPLETMTPVSIPDTRMYKTMPRYRSEVLDVDWVEIAPCGEAC